MVSQLLTLYITPVIYIYMEQSRNWLRRSKKTTTRPQEKWCVPLKP